jgi:hypothetical protein
VYILSLEARRVRCTRRCIDSKGLTPPTPKSAWSVHPSLMQFRVTRIPGSAVKTVVRYAVSGIPARTVDPNANVSLSPCHAAGSHLAPRAAHMGMKAALQQSALQQLRDPLAVPNVAFATRYLLNHFQKVSRHRSPVACLRMHHASRSYPPGRRNIQCSGPSTESQEYAAQNNCLYAVYLRVYIQACSGSRNENPAPDDA